MASSRSSVFVTVNRVEKPELESEMLAAAGDACDEWPITLIKNKCTYPWEKHIL